MWNKSISLPVREEREENPNGFETVDTTYMEHIQADFQDVTRDDEILGNQKGYQADVNVEIMACNYSGQSFLKDEGTGEIYDIKRSFRKNKSMKVTLTCVRRQHGTSQD